MSEAPGSGTHPWDELKAEPNHLVTGAPLEKWKELGPYEGFNLPGMPD